MLHRMQCDIVRTAGQTIQTLLADLQNEDELFASTATLHAVEAQLLVMSQTLAHLAPELHQRLHRIDWQGWGQLHHLCAGQQGLGRGLLGGRQQAHIVRRVPGLQIAGIGLLRRRRTGCIPLVARTVGRRHHRCLDGTLQQRHPGHGRRLPGGRHFGKGLAPLHLGHAALALQIGLHGALCGRLGLQRPAGRRRLAAAP